MDGLLTDFYQLTMAAGYHQVGKSGETATFELFIRKLPPNRNYILAAGLAQAVEYLQDLSFSAEDITYLRGLPQFENIDGGFFEALRRLHFTGDLHAVREGTPVFPGEPLLRVRAPLIQAQIVETYLLSTVGFQSMIATKASRLAEASAGRAVVEFGTRRAHSPEAGVLAGRAAYIGGCIGTSNTKTGRLYGVPVFGTAAHSWVLSFESELESFRALQQILGASTIYLVDSYDTLEGTRRAVSLGPPMWGVRLDSGNLVELSRSVRKILDEAGFPEARIMATGDLNEYKILEMMKEDLPIDAFGVGTELATSADAPHLGAIYKLVEVERNGETRFTAKFSEDKQTLPGAKQVFRYHDRDVIACASETPVRDIGGAMPEELLEPVMRQGRVIAPVPDVRAARRLAAESLGRLPTAYRSLFTVEAPYPVELSAALRELAGRTRAAVAEVRK